MTSTIERLFWALVELWTKVMVVSAAGAVVLYGLRRATDRQKRIAVRAVVAVLWIAAISVIAIPVQARLSILPPLLLDRIGIVGGPNLSVDGDAAPALEDARGDTGSADESSNGGAEPAASRGEAPAADVELGRRWFDAVADLLYVALPGVWLAGLCLLGVRFVVSLLRLRSIRAGATPATWDFPVDLTVGARPRLEALMHPLVASPVSFGFVRKVVVVPEGRNDSTARAVLIHELEHTRNNDFFFGLMLRLISILCWPAFLIQFVIRNVEYLQEQLCDDAVLRSGVDRLEYCEALVREARAAAAGTADLALSAGGRSSVATRVREILHGGTARHNRWRGSVLLAVLLSVALFSSLASCETVGDDQTGEPGSRVSLRTDAASVDPDQVKAEFNARFVRLGEFELLEGQRTVIQLPDNRMDLEELRLDVRVNDEFALVDWSVYWNGTRAGNSSDVIVMYPSGTGSGYGGGDYSFFLRIDTVSRIAPDAVRASLGFAVHSDEEMDRLMQAVDENARRERTTSVHGQVRYDLRSIDEELHSLPGTIVNGVYSTSVAEVLDGLMLPDPFADPVARYEYETGPHHFAISSVGPDNIPGTEDDPVRFSMTYSPLQSFTYTGTRGEIWSAERGTWKPLLALDLD